MKAFEYKDQWGNVTRVRLVRGAYADGSLAVQMLCEGEGYWEPYATLTVNLCDARNQNASFAYVDTNNLPTAPEFLVENGLATYTGMTPQRLLRLPALRVHVGVLRELLGGVSHVDRDGTRHGASPRSATARSCHACARAPTCD